MNTHKKYILVVDDDPDILDAIRDTLEDAGYEVKTTEKGEDAESLNNISGELPALIILDVLLSGMDGRVICKKLKKQKKTKHIPIIIISAHPSAGLSSTEAGADEFIAKPFDVDFLLEKIAQYL